MHGRMREHGAPAMDQGCGEGVPAGWLGALVWARSLRKVAASSNFNPEDNESASPVLEEFWVGSFLVSPRITASVKAVLRYCPLRMRSWPAWVRGNQGCVNR